MEIYVEDLFFTNFVMDYMLIFLAVKSLKKDVNKLRLFFSATIGAISCFLYPYLLDKIFLLNLYKFIIAYFMMFISVKKLNQKDMIFGMLILMLLSYLMAGALMSFSNIKFSNGFTFNFNSSVISIISISFVVFVITNKMYHLVVKKIKSHSYICKTKLSFNSKTVEVNALLDSGNSAIENNTPISFINFETFTKLTDINYHQFFKVDFSPPENFKYKEIYTLTGKKKLLIFKIDKIEINNGKNIEKYYNAYLALSLNFSKKDYEAILNANYIK